MDFDSTLWTNLVALSHRPDVDKSEWNIHACRLIDICTENTFSLDLAIEKAFFTITKLNAVFATHGLPTIITEGRDNTLRNELRLYARNIGVRFAG